MANNLTLPANIDARKARLPATYEQAKQALAKCDRINECKDYADKAEALATYAKQAKDNVLGKMADRIQARAVRRIGELLKEIEPASQENLKQNRRDGTVPSVTRTRTKAAADAGLSERQRKNALRVANVPEAEFEKAVESPNPPTVTTLAERGTTARESPPSAPPEDIVVRDIGRIVKTLEAFAGLVPHVSPRQFLEQADDDAMANAEMVTAWLTQLVALLEEGGSDEPPQSKTWRSLAPVGSLLKRKK
jgi:hypothetical protein